MSTAFFGLDYPQAIARLGYSPVAQKMATRQLHYDTHLFASVEDGVQPASSEPRQGRVLAGVAVPQPEVTNGTPGDDFFGGTLGDDTINGGDGNDTINDGGGGNDILNGEGGDDLIRIQRFGGTSNSITVNAGTGNDLLAIDASTGGLFEIDMGAGDDRIATFRDGQYATQITLGTGRDTVEYNSFSNLTFLDFATGENGDNFVPELLTFRAVGLGGANPFASGHLTLTQEGSASVLRFFRFGGAAGEELTIATFSNTLVDDFVAANFNGIDPRAGGPGETIVGTEGDDTLTGTDAADTINGLGGNDTIDGGDGDDEIDGGAGADTITGGLGDDTVRGGDGDDSITDAFGANTIYGDGGNDTINITGYFGSSFSSEPHRIFGGAGNDVVNYGLSSTDGLILDLGEGDDRINFIYPVGDNSLTLGLGSDIVDINQIQSISSSFAITITDFQTGDGGDRLAWEDFIAFRTGNSGDPDFNPFSYNEAELVQIGNDVHIVDSFALVIFRNTQVDDFTTFNLGFDPAASSAPGETFSGTAGRDFFQGTSRNDIMTGLGDDDSLEGRAGDDSLDGGDGNDFLDGGSGDDTIIGGAGDDEIFGRDGADVIDTGDGNDRIDGGGDTINAGAGDDTIVYTGPDMVIDGGAGFDTLEFSSTSQVLPFAVDVDFTNQPTTGEVLIGGRVAASIENILYLGEYSNFDDLIIFGANFDAGMFIDGGNGNDTLTGTNGDDTLIGGNGNDTLTGLGGNDQIEDMSGDNFIDGGDGDDVLIAGGGDDTILGGAGNDTIRSGMGVDSVDAGAGDDLVVVNRIDPGADLDGGAGNDTLRIGDGNSAVDIDLSASSAAPSTFRNFETLEFILSNFDDRLLLDDSYTQSLNLDAGAGNDTITGGSGDDVIIGNDGADVLIGGAGDDEITGGRVNDIGIGGDQLFGGTGNDTLRGNGLLDGGEGNDFLSGEGQFFGGAGNDSIVSFGDGDIVVGGAGDDDIALRGLNATVLLEAGLNRDRIDGAFGLDTIRATADGTRLQWTSASDFSATDASAIIDDIDIISDNGFADFRIVGTQLNDLIQLSGGFGSGNVTIEGRAPIYGLGGNDDITGSLSDDIIFGGEGNDILRSSAGSDQLHGGEGDDRYFISSVGHTLIENAGEGEDIVFASVDITIGDHIERLELQGNARVGIGSNTDNKIIGSSGNNELYGLAGNDRLEGGMGDDLLDGGLGDDILLGGIGKDHLIDFNGFNILDGGSEDDVIEGDGILIGGQGDDILRGGGLRDLLNGGEGADLLDGGGGNDVADYRGLFDPVIVDLRNTGPQNTQGGGIDTLISIEDVIGTDGSDQIIGNDNANVLQGWFGNDELRGGSNIDTAVFSGDLSQYTVVQFVDRSFGVIGPDGEDLLVDIEFAQFDDQTLRLLPGLGVSVNFETSDASIYQSAMNDIRDFDGNSLGGNGSWLRIGSADVNGDGDIDQILVNDAIGRFATVGTTDDGLVYFEDHSWAGETRVAGIYIDPLVALGIVAPGSDNDSQRRFQNDLQIENINRVLGADDYDGDGFQEVYFALTDGTAYLRAIMEFDGNISYANYQSEQDVIDYLTANGFGEETYGDWFNANPQGGPQAGPQASTSSTTSLFTPDPIEAGSSGLGLANHFEPEFFG